MIQLKYLSFGCLFLSVLRVSADICEEQWQLQIDASKVQVLGDNITAYGEVYLPNTFKKTGNKYFVCPCSADSYCMHRCSREFENFYYPQNSKSKLYTFVLYFELSVCLNPDYDSDSGASQTAIKQANSENHHNFYSCDGKYCTNVVEGGYQIMNENSTEFFFFYAIDEPYKFDNKREHVMMDENSSLHEYANDDQYCFTVENEVWMNTPV